MRYRRLRPFSLFGAPVLFAALLWGVGAAAAELPQQSSQAAGVSISVKPTEVDAKADTWLFQVALNTHSGDLGDDLARTATIVDGAGKEQPAAAWEGDAAGGHHRKGVLRFAALSPRPEVLELRIKRPGEDGPRTFRWKLK